MTSNQKTTKHLLPLFAALITSTLQAADNAIPTSMVGHWQGTARVVVDWCKQPNLAVEIDIHPNGVVTGKVGNATLTRGQVTGNRGWIGRKLNLATDYIIRGDLAGPVVAAESISRSSVGMPIDLVSGTLVGGIHTNGSKFGGKQDGVLSAASLKLQKQNQGRDSR